MTKNPQALILEALASGPSYGLELVERTGLGVGTVYNHLKLLRKVGAIEELPYTLYSTRPQLRGRPRTYYRLVK